MASHKVPWMSGIYEEQWTKVLRYLYPIFILFWLWRRSSGLNWILESFHLFFPSRYVSLSFSFKHRRILNYSWSEKDLKAYLQHNSFRSNYWVRVLLMLRYLSWLVGSDVSCSSSCDSPTYFFIHSVEKPLFVDCYCIKSLLSLIPKVRLVLSRWQIRTIDILVRTHLLLHIFDKLNAIMDILAKQLVC